MSSAVKKQKPGLRGFDAKKMKFISGLEVRCNLIGGKRKQEALRWLVSGLGLV